jgi:hypothetical protein
LANRQRRMADGIWLIADSASPSDHATIELPHYPTISSLTTNY